MASSSSTYFFPGPPSSNVIGSKSILIKQSPPTMFQQFPHPHHRPPVLSHSHQQIIKSIPANDTFHSLTANNTNHDDSGGSNGHSLSQSMESINNIGLTDDEVKERFFCFIYSRTKKRS
jgi:hypothetical protein